MHDNMSQFSPGSNPTDLLRKLTIIDSLRPYPTGRLRRILNKNLLLTSQESGITSSLEDYNQNCNNSFYVYRCFSKEDTQVYNQVLHLTRIYNDICSKCISVSNTSYLSMSVSVDVVLCASNILVYVLFVTFFNLQCSI